MSRREPYVLPGLPGGKTLADNLEQGAMFSYVEDDDVYSFRGLLPDGHWVLYSIGDEPEPLMLPDPKTGFPAHPTQEQILALMVSNKLALITSPLDEPARDRARKRERTKQEVLKADPYARVRMTVCRTWDATRPALDDASLEDWRDEKFDWEKIEKDFGRTKPPASTLRSWIRKRGRPGNRCWADMEDVRGQGSRRKRVAGHRLAIAVWHATSYWTARRHPTIARLYEDVKTDTDAFCAGTPLMMHGLKKVWPKPDVPIRPADREFFRQLVRRLESRVSYRHRYSAQAAQQRWEGGGGALEPTRFLEVAQQDEAEAPGFFFIDSINRVALGNATWVIAVDIYTRCILAWDLSFDAPSTVSWMRNVLNASRWKPLPREYAERFPQLATIGGRVSTMMYDNAAHAIGTAVEDAHGDVVQDVVIAGDRQPTHKAVVERVHETVRLLFSAALPGAKMQIALAREFNIDASKERLVTLDEARLAMARAVCKYHLKKGDDGQCPLDRWIEQWERWGPQHPRDQEQFERAIGNVTLDRVLDNGGIVHNYLEYSDREATPRLMEAYARHSHHRRRKKKPGFNAKVKWDPTDLSHISVFDPSTGRFVKLPAKKRRYAAGLTLAMHKLVMRYRGAKSLLASPDGESRLMEIRRITESELARISPKMEYEEKRARAAIMQQPALRELMGGDIHLVQVEPSVTGMGVDHDLGFDRPDAFDKPPRSKRGSAENEAVIEQKGDAHVVLPAPEGLLENDGEGGDLPDASNTEGPAGDVSDPVRHDDDDDDVLSTFDDY